MNVEALKKMSVICVDDEQDALEQMNLALSSFCKKIVCVGSVEKALRAMEESQPDIVLTDIRMPGTTGLELLATIKQKSPSTDVIIVSAHSESQYLLDAIRLKADGFLLKPINLYEMLELLSTIATQKTMKMELDQKNFMLKMLSSIGGKRVQIIEYVMSHLDSDMLFHGTYDEVADALGTSKPTVVSAFQDLLTNNVLTRVKNGVYKMNM